MSQLSSHWHWFSRLQPLETPVCPIAPWTRRIGNTHPRVTHCRHARGCAGDVRSPIATRCDELAPWGTCPSVLQPITHLGYPVTVLVLLQQLDGMYRRAAAVHEIAASGTGNNFPKDVHALEILGWLQLDLGTWNSQRRTLSP